IDDDPLSLPGRTVAVEGKVHADLADPAQRAEHQFAIARSRHPAALSHGRGGGDRTEMHVPGRDRDALPVIAADDEAACFVDRLERAAHDPPVDPYGHDRTEPRRMAQPALTDGRKAAAAVPYRGVRHPCAGQRQEKRLRSEE